jgi:dUTP pyrophosphatase
MEEEKKKVYFTKSKFVEMPRKATKGSIGYDGRLASNQRITIGPHARVTIDTGIHLQPDPDIYAQVMLRSSFGSKGVLLISGGLIDSDFRGPIKLKLMNLNPVNITIEPNQSYYQIVFKKSVPIELIETDHLDETERNHEGFGSTGF